MMEPRNPKDAHADYLAGWLYSQIQRGPIDVETWNKAVQGAEAFQGQRNIATANRAANGKRNAMSARRRTGGK